MTLPTIIALSILIVIAAFTLDYYIILAIEWISEKWMLLKLSSFLLYLCIKYRNDRDNKSLKRAFVGSLKVLVS